MRVSTAPPTVNRNQLRDKAARNINGREATASTWYNKQTAATTTQRNRTKKGCRRQERLGCILRVKMFLPTYVHFLALQNRRSWRTIHQFAESALKRSSATIQYRQPTFPPAVKSFGIVCTSPGKKNMTALDRLTGYYLVLHFANVSDVYILNDYENTN